MVDPQRALRVAFVTVGDTGRKTGGHLYNARVLAGLEARGVEVHRLVVGGSDPKEQQKAAPRAGTMLNLSSYDAVLVDALARKAVAPHLDRWRASSPVVALVHELPSVAGGEAGGTAGEKRHEEPLLRADLVVAVSEHGESLLKGRGVAPGRVRVVPPGCDRLVPPGGVPARRRVGPVRALCVAQWIPRKGILTLVEAWGRRPRPGAELELVGETDADPAYASSVREAIAEAEGPIAVSGAVGDAALADAYASADLFVLPSRYEGYGMVFAEALLFGLPVVACGVGPVPDLVGAEAALLVPPDDPRALCEALDLLLGDHALRGRMSVAARRRAAGLPRWEATVAGLHEALREAVAERGRPGGFGSAPVEGHALREQNRRSWNAAVGAHESHRGDLARFLREGGSTLFPEELGLLGDLVGHTLAHLQCNAGGDSLSLAALGAEVVGVDLSDEAVRAARRLSKEAGIPARFERADLYEWLQDAAGSGRRFDAVYASYGAVCWLPDLDPWAAGIAAVLEPGGRFVLVEFHPAAETFDAGWNPVHDYPSGGEILCLEEGVGDYVGQSAGGLTPAGFSEGLRAFENPEPCHLFRWGLGEVVTALAAAGLRIAVLQEYPHVNGERHFSGMRDLPGRRLAPPEGFPRLPLMYGLRAEKPRPDAY